MFLMHSIIKTLVDQRYKVELVGKFAASCAYTVVLSGGPQEHDVLAATLVVAINDDFSLDMTQGGPTLRGTGFIEFKKALKSESLLCQFEKVDE